MDKEALKGCLKQGFLIAMLQAENSQYAYFYESSGIHIDYRDDELPDKGFGGRIPRGAVEIGTNNLIAEEKQNVVNWIVEKLEFTEEEADEIWDDAVPYQPPTPSTETSGASPSPQ